MTRADHTHEDLRLLLAPYALGVADPEDSLVVEDHLTGCAACADELGLLQQSADRLAAQIVPVQPPADLRDRVLAGLHTTQGNETVAQQESAVAEGSADEIGTLRRARARRASHPRRRWTQPALATLAAAVIGLAGFGLGQFTADPGGASPRDESPRPGTPVSLETNGALSDASITLVQFRGDGVLFIDGLAVPKGTRVWQIWGIDRYQHQISLAVLDGGQKDIVVPLGELRVRQIETVAITLEPAGGSKEPTTLPAAHAKLI